MIDEFGDEVPFEDLDTCCQKEVLSNRRYREVTAKLRESDVSNNRLDQQRAALSNLWKTPLCECCSASSDYPILAQLRSKRTATEQVYCQEVSVPVDEESDSDFDDDDFLSAAEQERRLDFLQLQQTIALAQSIGYGAHLEDSLDHLVSAISLGLPVVLHIVSTDETLCGELDLVLENLSLKYLGTRFRRIRCTRVFMSEAEKKLQVFGVTAKTITSDGCLLCFHNNYLSAVSNNFAEFSECSSIFEQDLVKFLDAARVLSVDVPLAYVQQLQNSKLVKSGEEDAEEEAYCDDPECTRKYAHEHVGGAEKKAASYMSRDNAAGAEALAKNALYTL